MKKEYVIEAMKELPHDFESERLLEKLIFMEKVEKGLAQLEQGNTISHDKVQEISKQWLRLSGPSLRLTISKVFTDIFAWNLKSTQIAQ